MSYFKKSAKKELINEVDLCIQHCLDIHNIDQNRLMLENWDNIQQELHEQNLSHNEINAIKKATKNRSEFKSHVPIKIYSQLSKIRQELCNL